MEGGIVRIERGRNALEVLKSLPVKRKGAKQKAETALEGRDFHRGIGVSSTESKQKKKDCPITGEKPCIN